MLIELVVINLREGRLDEDNIFVRSLKGFFFVLPHHNIQTFLHYLIADSEEIFFELKTEDGILEFEGSVQIPENAHRQDILGGEDFYREIIENPAIHQILSAKLVRRNERGDTYR